MRSLPIARAHIGNRNVLVIDGDAEIAQPADRARKALGLHAEAIGDQRLLVGQNDHTGTAARAALLDQEIGDALRGGQQLDLLDLLDEELQVVGRRGQHAEREVWVLADTLAQVLSVNFQQARRRHHLGIGRIAAAEKHGGLGKGLTAPEHADDGLAALRGETRNLHPALENDIEGIGRIPLLEEQRAFFVAPRP
ncbi:MAG: hypothetical protein ABS54_07370 [Hyphomicrobium sp. SCN 65-11]|nr:MAG: hypothetical protein ABS54_07370 [Hyphomicrobium sp. SCN 65-11]